MVEESLLFTPEGVRDIYGEDLEKRLFVENEIHKIMKLYGFKDIQTPTFEFFKIFGSDIKTAASKDMFKFFDQYNNTLVLRPDITPQIARCVAKYYEKEDMQIRLCYRGNTFVHRSGYQGKLSEVTQLGAELMNDNTSDADGEMIVMTIESLLKTGLKDFKIDIGHVEIFRGLVEQAGLAKEEIEKLKKYLQNKNIFAVEEMLEDKNIDNSIKDLLCKLPDLFGGIETIKEVMKIQGINERTLQALDRLEKLNEIIESYDLEEYITFDLGMNSNYEYYTGVIFKAYTYGTGNAIVTGGRYDNLIEQFGKPASAIGLAFMVDELMNALESQKALNKEDAKDIVILYRSVNRKTAIAMAGELRKNNNPVKLMRKNADISIDIYKEYAKRTNVEKIIYIDDTGEVREF